MYCDLRMIFLTGQTNATTCTRLTADSLQSKTEANVECKDLVTSLWRTRWGSNSQNYHSNLGLTPPVIVRVKSWNQWLKRMFSKMMLFVVYLETKIESFQTSIENVVYIKTNIKRVKKYWNICLDYKDSWDNTLPELT